MNYEIQDARRIAEEVRYHMEARMPVRFGSSESSFIGLRPVKPYYLLIMLLYAIFRVLAAMASAHTESHALQQRLLEELVICHMRKVPR